MLVNYNSNTNMANKDVDVPESNFTFLQSECSKLAELGSAAEQYVYSDPQAAVVKLRCFTEYLVGELYSALSIEIEPQADLYHRLSNNEFKSTVDKAIVTKLHALRQHGNKAAHNNTEHSTTQTLWLLEEAFLVGKWFFQTFNKTHLTLPEFQTPPPIHSIQQALSSENEALQRQLRTNSEVLTEAERELSELRKQIAENQKSIDSSSNYHLLEEFKHASKEAASSFDLQMNVTRQNINIFDSFSEHSLTQGQTNLVSKIGQFLNQSDESVFLLKGYAGTGKTFVTEGLTQYLDTIGRQFVLLAPTGKAAKVIGDKTGQEASTIHRVIYNYENVKEYKLDDLDGSETFRCYAEIKVNQHTSETVYIIDESSMVSDSYSDSEFFRFGSGYLLKDLLSFINVDHNDHTKKIIFIGDNAQLPPVGMNFSPALSEAYLLSKYQLTSQEFELSEVVRQKSESGIMDNARLLREAMELKEFNKLDFQVNDIDVCELSADDFLNQFLRVCDNKISNTKHSILIASSNSQVSRYNKVVREHFFPKQLQVVAGDKIISVANHYFREKVITNGEFGMVRQVLSPPEVKHVVLSRKGEDGRTVKIRVELTFRDVELGFRDENGDVSFFSCKVIENLLYNDEPSLSSDEYKALYVDFRNRHKDLLSKAKSSEFRMALLADPYFNAFKIKFGYAITCHKAQGSEWQNVFLKCSSHHRTLSQDYFRWLYTAITRSSSKLYVIDPPKIKLGMGIKRVASTTLAPSQEVVHSEEISHKSTHVIQDGSHTGSANEDFSIPKGNVFLQNVFNEVKSALIGTGVSISDITHNQYQEVYSCQLGDVFSTVRISYNAKRKVTAVTCNELSPLDTVLSQRLGHLKGKIFTSFEHSTHLTIELPEPFLEEFHRRLCAEFTLHDIAIEEVRARKFVQRYCFRKLNDTAVVDIFYNGKNQFTKFMGMSDLSTSYEFLVAVEDLIEKELS